MPVAWKHSFQATGIPTLQMVHYNTSCKHSLLLLKMDEIIARNTLSWLELLINRYCCVELVVYIICINDAWSKKYQIWRRWCISFLWSAHKSIQCSCIWPVTSVQCLSIRSCWFRTTWPSHQYLFDVRLATCLRIGKWSICSDKMLNIRQFMDCPSK